MIKKSIIFGTKSPFVQRVFFVPFAEKPYISTIMTFFPFCSLEHLFKIPLFFGTFWNKKKNFKVHLRFKIALIFGGL